MAATTWRCCDILYRVTDSTQQSEIDALLYSLVAIEKYDVLVPVTEFIQKVRECVYEFAFNNLYYRVNVGNVGQTNLNMFFHFANVDDKTSSDVIQMYERVHGLGGLLRNLMSQEKVRNPKIDKVYPACYETFKYTFPFNEQYFFKAIEEFLVETDFSCNYITKKDFNFVMLYLIIHDMIRLSVKVVGSYIYKQFNPFDYVRSQLESILCSMQF